ncbi:hypothetical protein JZ751_027335, partial [Albula glossodonta]
PQVWTETPDSSSPYLYFYLSYHAESLQGNSPVLVPEGDSSIIESGKFAISLQKIRGARLHLKEGNSILAASDMIQTALGPGPTLSPKEPGRISSGINDDHLPMTFGNWEGKSLPCLTKRHPSFKTVGLFSLPPFSAHTFCRSFPRRSITMNLYLRDIDMTDVAGATSLLHQTQPEFSYWTSSQWRSPERATVPHPLTVLPIPLATHFFNGVLGGGKGGTPECRGVNEYTGEVRPPCGEDICWEPADGGARCLLLNYACLSPGHLPSRPWLRIPQVSFSSSSVPGTPPPHNRLIKLSEAAVEESMDRGKQAGTCRQSLLKPVVSTVPAPPLHIVGVGGGGEAWGLPVQARWWMQERTIACIQISSMQERGDSAGRAPNEACGLRRTTERPRCFIFSHNTCCLLPSRPLCLSPSTPTPNTSSIVSYHHQRGTDCQRTEYNCQDHIPPR